MRTTRPQTAWIVVLLALGTHALSALPVCVAVVDSPVDATHPALDGRVGPPCGGHSTENADQEDPHGTAVASVIISYSRHARVGGIPWDYRTRTDWYEKIARCLRYFPAECGSAIEWIEVYLDEYAQLWPRFPIVSASVGMHLRVGSEPVEPRTELLRWIIDQVRQSNPSLWHRYTQSQTPPKERSIYLRSAGPKRLNSGSTASLLDRAILVNHTELWGHSLIVTAIDPRANNRLASYADHCGLVPAKWNPGRTRPALLRRRPGHPRSGDPRRQDRVPARNLILYPRMSRQSSWRCTNDAGCADRHSSSGYWSLRTELRHTTTRSSTAQASSQWSEQSEPAHSPTFL